MLMTHERALIIIILLSAAVVTLSLSVIAWRRRASAGPPAIYFSLCMAAVSIYSFGYGMEVSSSTLPDIMFWVRFQHWGIQAVTPTWFLFSICLAGKEKFITPKRIAALFVIPVFLLLAAQTLGTYNLWHLNPGLNTAGPFPTFTYERGFIAWLGTAYSSLCLAFSTILFTVMLFTAAPAFRKQAAILLTGSLIPWFGLLLYMFGLTPYNLDFAPLALSLSGLFFALGFLRFRLLDIVPLARDVVFEGMSDGVLVLDIRDRIIDFNPCLQTILPEIRKTSIGFPVFEALTAYPVLLKRIQENSSETAELRITRAGASYYYQCSLMPLFGWRKKPVGKIIAIHDHTQVKQLLERLEEIANLDGLTRLYNRRHFNVLAAKEVYRFQRYGGALSLIMLDLDHFKLINDTHGHMAGDAALKTVAQTCRETLRQSDIIGRFGGEEFVILLPGTDQTAAAQFAQKLRSALEQGQVQYEELCFVVTASFGVAGMTSPANASLEELFRCADRAVYEAKETGRNRVCVSKPPDGI
jgi:diguanylate cyclase (GGDEF)-like protein